ncbi:histidine phosphatase superfamily [Apiospora arundinis]
MGRYKFSLVPNIFDYEYEDTESNEQRAKEGKGPKPPTLRRVDILGLKEHFDGPESADGAKLPPWARVRPYLTTLNDADRDGARHKVIFVLRHGFSLHNYIEQGVKNDWRGGIKLAYREELDFKSLEKAWKEAGGQVSSHLKALPVVDHEKPEAKVPLYDAPLLEKDDVQKLLGSGASKNDAGDLGNQWFSWVEGNKMPLPDAIYTSPLRRCLKTTEKVYRRVFEAHAEEGCTFRPIVKENLREKRNGDACNYRSSKSYITNNFNGYELEPDFVEEDPYRSDIEKVEREEGNAKESDEKLEGRMRQVLDDIFDDDKTQVVSLTTHSFSIGALTKVIGFQCILHEGDITAFLVKATPLERKDRGMKIWDKITCHGSGDSGRAYLPKLPPEVLHLILGHFCQHCRGERTGSAPGVYFDRAADPESSSSSSSSSSSFASSLHCPQCRIHYERPMYPQDPSCYAAHYPSHTLAEYHQDKANLRSLCLVSRALRAAAQPFLYHLYRPGDDYPQLFRLAGSLADRDDLAAAVRSLCLGHSYSGVLRVSWHRSLTSPAATCLQGLLSRFPPQDDDDDDDDGKQVEESSPSPTTKFTRADLIARLVRLLPSLTDLNLGTGELYRESCGELHDPSENDIVPSGLEQVDYLPLRTFEVSSNAGGLHTFFNFTRLARRPPLSLPNLQALRITESRLDANELRYLLEACTAWEGSNSALRDFVYDAAEVYRPVRYQNYAPEIMVGSVSSPKADINPTDIVKTLQPFRATLESLHLNVHQFLDIPGVRPPAPLPSLAGFTALRRLLLDWRSICGGYGRKDEDSDEDQSQRLVSILPESIESLYVIGCVCEVHPARLGRALEGLAAAMTVGQCRFPHLRRVGCDIRRAYRRRQTIGKTPEDPDGAVQNAAWRDMFSVAGVQFEYDLEWECSPGQRGPYVEARGYLLVSPHQNGYDHPLPPDDESDHYEYDSPISPITPISPISPNSPNYDD